MLKSKRKHKATPTGHPRNFPRVGSGIYSDGQRVLFVPPAGLYEARNAVLKQRKEGKAISIDEIERDTRSDIVRRNLKRFGAVAWFRGWLLNGDTPPADVRVASEADVRRVTAAWNAGNIMREISKRYSVSDYCKFFTRTTRPQGDFPAERIADFLIWLFTAKKIDGWLILKEWTVNFRGQLTPRSLRDGANVSLSWYKKMMRSNPWRSAVVTAVAAARAGRDPAPLFANMPAEWPPNWRKPIDAERVASIRTRLAAGESANSIAAAVGCCRKTVAQVKNGTHRFAAKPANWRRQLDCAVRFAKAARDSEAEARTRIAKPSDSASVAALRTEAKHLGVWLDVEKWLYTGLAAVAAGDEDVDSSRNSGFRRRGQIADRVYLPFPLMTAFQNKAKAAWKESEIWRLADDLPCFSLWFADSVLPAPKRGRRCPYREALGLAQKRSAAYRTLYRNDPEALRIERPTVRTPPTDVAALVHDNSAEPLPEHNRRRRRGRPVDPQVAQRNAEMIEAWRSREYSNFGKLGQRFGVSRAVAKKVIDSAVKRN